MNDVEKAFRRLRIRDLELKLLAKRVELVEVQVGSFSLWWRTALRGMKTCGS
jgi:hypothetical protein